MGLLEGLDHATLYQMREKAKGTPEFENLAPYEHQAFAREWVKERPILGTASLAVASPLYYLAKQPGLLGLAQKMGLVGEDATPSSLKQLGASYRGIGQGLGLL